jgi:hypothetical protein
MTKRKNRRKRNHSKAMHDEKKTNHEERKRNEEQCSTSVYMKSGVAIDLAESLKQEHYTERREDKAHDKRQLFWAKVSAGLIFVYAAITFWQGCETHDILTTTKKQFGEDQRPFVTPDTYVMLDSVENKAAEPVKGKPIYVNIRFHNTGKTPALDTVIHRHMLWGYEAISHMKAEPLAVAMPGKAIEQGGHSLTEVVSTRNTFANETLEVDASDIVPWDGAMPIVVFGRVTYHDRTGKQYCTPYAVHYIPGGSWSDIPAVTNNGKIMFRLTDLCPSGSGTIF